jgi:hypothetical protein
MKQLVLALAIVGGSLFCKGADQGPPVSQATPAAVARLDSLVARLLTVQGTLDSSWTFTGEDAVFRSIGALADSGAAAIADTAVARLVMCLGRPDSAAITSHNRRVPVAVVCYKALMGLAYHEEGDSTGGLTGDWPGYLTGPDATNAELRAAYEAWMHVVRHKDYTFL